MSSTISTFTHGRAPRHVRAAPRFAPVTSALAVAVLAIATCAIGIHNDFSYDDISLIQNDPRVHSLLAWPSYFTTTYWPAPWPPDLYRPLSTTLFALENVIGAGLPLLFRLVSYALYAGACVATGRLARRPLAPGVALGIALLFAAHPVHVEAVALAVNQSEFIVAILCTAATARYLDARRRGAPTPSDWTLIATAYAAASLFKETGLVLPALLLAAELCLVNEPARDRMRDRMRVLWRGFACLGVIATLALIARSLVIPGGGSGTFTAEALVGLGPGGRALTMLKVVPEWLRLLAWPARLQIDYSPGVIVASSHVGLAESLGIALICGAATLAWISRRAAPAVSFGIAWCALALLPVSNVLVPTGIVLGERTLFLPSIGFVVAVGGALQWLRAALPRASLPEPALRIACAALVTAGLVRSAARERDFQNNWVLWYHTARVAPTSYRAQHAFGWILFQVNQPDSAIAAYRRAIAYSPEPQWIRDDLADQLRDRGNDSLALPELEASLRELPNQPVAKTGLIADLIALGRYEDAMREAADAVARHMATGVTTRLAQVADSAKRAGAPPGSVRLKITTAPTRAQFGP